MQTQKQSVARTQGDVAIAYVEPLKLTKRIGSTTFTVSVHFNQSGKESVEDKLLRLMERDVEDMFSSTSAQYCSPASQEAMKSGITPTVATPSIPSEVSKSA